MHDVHKSSNVHTLRFFAYSLFKRRILGSAVAFLTGSSFSSSVRSSGR